MNFRLWYLNTHRRHLTDGQWVPMYDPNGKEFTGIEGKHGVRGQKKDGTYIGCDFIRMQPGSSFPFHTHDGDHELYFIEGNGFVHINGKDAPVLAGHVIHIPSEYPHGVWVPKDAPGPLIFVATGHPHKHVDSHDRLHYTKSLSDS